MTPAEAEARFAALELRLAQLDAQLAITRRAVARLEARDAVTTAGITHLAGRLATVTADDNGEYPGDVELAAGSVKWVQRDGATWAAALPDGRTAVVERLDDGASFLPRVHESRTDFTTGPVCARLLGAMAWCAEQAAK